MKKLLYILFLLPVIAQAQQPWHVDNDFGGRSYFRDTARFFGQLYSYGNTPASSSSSDSVWVKSGNMWKLRAQSAIGGSGGFGTTSLSASVAITGNNWAIAWNGVQSNIFNDGTSNRIGYNGTNSYIGAPNGVNLFVSDNNRNQIEGPLRIVDMGAQGNGMAMFDNDGDVSIIPLAWQTISDGATLTFDASSYINASTTLGGNRTLAFSNLSSAVGKVLTYEFIQDGTGGRTLTLPGICKVVNGGGGAITLSTTPGAVDVLQFLVKSTSVVYVTYGPNFN